MRTSRLEAFSDGVIAVIITIMVLELRPPDHFDLLALKPLLPVFLGYLTSFVFIGIYWNNHHHLLHAAEKVNGSIMWANLHLLFWLSLTPFLTAWMGRNPGAKWPAALYGLDLLMSAIAFTILALLIIAYHGKDSLLARALGSNLKGNISIAMYVLGIGLALFVSAWAAYAVYVLVALIWFIPDSRIERRVYADAGE